MPRPGERPGATEFACTFWPPFRGVALLLLVFTPILWVAIDDPQRHWSVAPLAYLAVTMLPALPIGFMIWAYRVDTDSAGIGGQTIWICTAGLVGTRSHPPSGFRFSRESPTHGSHPQPEGP